ncbi:MAG: aminopeptidase [Acidobacteriota bacterium]
MRTRTYALSLALVASFFVKGSAQTPASMPFDHMAQRIVDSLQVTKGERVLLRYDPETLGPLEPSVRQLFLQKGAVVDTLNYGPAADLQARLDRTDIYVWLPAGPNAATAADQREMLAKWLDAGKGRQIHFHWVGGTVDPDGRGGVHSAAFDKMYVDALDIDYKKLSAGQDKIIAKLRTGEVHVTTPAGTDIRFKVGDRPFNKQDGDASKAHVDQAKTRVDREVELPAGVIRVAPIETTANGVLVVAQARLLNDAKATGIRLEFTNGKIVKATAKTGEDALKAFLASSPTLTSFREFCLGVNPKLVVPAGSAYLPYYGYGDAVVRMSLGDNTELAGAVRGGASRWLFFPDTTVTVGDEKVVVNGRLAPAYR